MGDYSRKSTFQAKNSTGSTSAVMLLVLAIELTLSLSALAVTFVMSGKSLVVLAREEEESVASICWLL